MLSVEAVDLYYGASHALRRVSLTANKGEVTCILGRNGVGKTSLLRAIFGLQAIRSGHIRWEDRDLTGLPPHERARAGLALVPQGREIFPRLTVLENLMTGFATLPRSLRHIPDEIFALFPVLKDMLSRRGGDLSGGQQVRLTTGEFDLLAAFVNNPNQVLSRDRLLDLARNREAGPFDRTIDVQVGRLRRKLEDDPQNPSLIKTVRGSGYIFTPTVEFS